MKVETGEIRDKLNGPRFAKWIFPFPFYLWAISLMDVHHKLGWVVYFMLTLTYAAVYIAYEALRNRNWRVILSEDTVTIRNSFGREKQYPREQVQWDIGPSEESRGNAGGVLGVETFNVRLRLVSSGKRLAKVREYSDNVQILFSLEHLGPMSQNEIIWFNKLRLKK